MLAMKSKKPTRDQYTVVLEGIRSDFKVFGEALSVVRREVEGHSKILLSHDSKFDKLESDMQIVKGELALIRHNQVTRDEFKLLQDRVLRLEKKVH